VNRAACAGLLLLAGCVGSPVVERAYEDRSVDGRFIDEGAYAAFLRGAIAEQSGDLRGALAGYEQAAAADPAGAEIWTRVGAVRCAIDRTDARADRALSRALALAPNLGPAWEARAACAEARGDRAGARSDRARAEALDPDAPAANPTRIALVARTITARDRLAAWAALAAWAEAHGDAGAWSDALVRLVRLDPSRREGIARVADGLAASHLAEARAVAAAVVDASTEPFDGDRDPVCARLAVDEALARGDRSRALSRATAARLPLEEVAARAFLLGQPTIAESIASEVAAAEPGNLGARLVLAAVRGTDLVGASRALDTPPSSAVSGATLVAFGAALVHAVAPDQARWPLARIPHAPLVAGDARVVKGAAALVASGALDPGVLPRSVQ
jgi:tetratricopeptide (TPR) repeat protein